jgi:predicted lactoylglutathione lyase
VCLSCETRDRVDDLVAAAVAAGATIYSDPKDYGFMYAHSFQDLDGHIWELIYMDPGLASRDNGTDIGAASTGGAG